MRYLSEVCEECGREIRTLERCVVLARRRGSMTDQRYVSKELTHFVGRGLTEGEQYSVLVDGILKGRWLRHSPKAEGPPGPTELLETGTVHAMGIDKFAPLDEMYAQTVVCFCDIPVSDLEIHMSKYSRFGLSFLKPFLVDKGASPVFYVAKDSGAMPYGVDERRPDSLYKVPRELVFGNNLRKYLDLFWKLRLGDPPRYNNGLLVDFPEEHSALGVLQSFLDFYVFSFMKYFDADASDDDPTNVYMEREWRVVGDVHFDLRDVYRVILPRSYAERFRRDLPDVLGQVTFVEP